MIVTVKGREVIIDDSALPIFESRVWHINDQGYVVWRGITGGIKKTIRFHREVIGAVQGQIVDHINRNKLDNRLENLRITTQQVNSRNCDRYDNAKHYYFDNRRRRWTVDSRTLGIKSLYFDSEQDAKDYVRDLLNGNTPIRKFTPMDRSGFNSSSAKITLDMAETIDSLYLNGFIKRAIAQEVGISESAVGRYLNGRTKFKPVDKPLTQ